MDNPIEFEGFTCVYQKIDSEFRFPLDDFDSIFKWWANSSDPYTVFRDQYGADVGLKRADITNVIRISKEAHKNKRDNDDRWDFYRKQREKELEFGA